MSRQRPLVLAAWMLLLVAAGCATTPPSSFYTLNALPGARGGVSGGAISVGLGPATFPTFLDRPQIVSRDANNQITVDEYHRWGGTLQDDFLRVWSENLGYLLETSRIVIFPSEVRYPLDFRVSADVLNFEAGNGEAVLKVRWAVLDPYLEQALAVHENTYRQRFSEPGDEAAMVGAMSATLADFSRDVAAALRSTPKPLPTPKTSPLY